MWRSANSNRLSEYYCSNWLGRPSRSGGSTRSARCTRATGHSRTTGDSWLQGPTGATGSQGPTGAVAVSFLQGKGLGVTGDSISALFNNAWQNVVVKRTGMSLVTQDARPGRRFDTTFECWGNPQAGGALGAFTAGYSFPGIGGTCGDYQTGLTDGMSFTDSLANTDLQIIEMGTNDQAVPLGQLGDATNAGRSTATCVGW